VLVARPNTGALREADRTAGELRALGVDNQMLVLNAVFHAQDRTDRVAVAFEQRCTAALDSMPASLRALPRHEGLFAFMEIAILQIVSVPMSRISWGIKLHFPADHLSLQNDLKFRTSLYLQ
jgi:hypothetical protein